MTELTIYHNPNCTKSRATLALLRERGLEPRVIEYLKTPPNALELKAVIEKLGVKLEQFVRKGEEIYRAKYPAKRSPTESGSTRWSATRF